jgi:hypothetical protein
MQIKFSHAYPKLHRQTSATLLDILLRDRSELTKNFIEYDTVYAGGHYPLPSGRYMVLLFLGNDLIPFTTVRSFSQEKFLYYNRYVGKIFDIIIKPAENCKSEPQVDSTSLDDILS